MYSSLRFVPNGSRKDGMHEVFQQCEFFDACLRNPFAQKLCCKSHKYGRKFGGKPCVFLTAKGPLVSGSKGIPS